MRKYTSLYIVAGAFDWTLISAAVRPIGERGAARKPISTLDAPTICYGSQDHRTAVT
jgi:hypothetical protein